MPGQAGLTIRPARTEELGAINGVIERAVMGWQLPERVKRLSIASYRYRPDDLEHMSLLVARYDGDEIVGVAACEPLAASESPRNAPALLLHGLYIEPDRQHLGIGSRLLAAVEEHAAAAGFSGLLVRAQADAAGFFSARGMQALDVADGRRDHPYRYWRAIDRDGRTDRAD
jgi:GNAT superfamily N-acetyltransferase